MRLSPCLVLFASLAACTREVAPTLGTVAAPDPRPAYTADAGADFAYAELDIAQLQARMATGELSSLQLTQAYLDRISAIDDAGPTLNAVIETNADALQEARALDAERQSGQVRGPLHGIPVLLKDNIDATPMVNSAGSLALAGHRPKSDAFLVARLRGAGAVVLGKTNLSEWANFRSTRSSSGWSSRGGQTRNPYALDRNPCGSSAGTGSAIAASLATIGVGTETNGSIICPAAVNGLVGLKPTVGLVSRSGIIPISRSQDTAGPMTRSVADAAHLLTAMVGRDEADAATHGRTGDLGDYALRLDANGLKGARIGVLRDAMGFQPDVDAAMVRAITTIQAGGATVVDASIPTAGQWNQAELEVLLYEFKAGLEEYLVQSQAPIRTLAGLIDFNARNAQQVLPHFGQELFLEAQTKGTLQDTAYLDARAKARRLAGPQGLEAALKAHNLDALIAPATSPAWPTDLVNGDHFTAAGYGVAAVAGTPSLTVPMGESYGLPVAIVFLGPAWSEGRLIELGFAFEQATRARKAPKFLRTIEPARASADARRSASRASG